MCHMDKNRARDACTKGLEGLTTASWDRNENLGGERDTRSAQAAVSRGVCAKVTTVERRLETNLCFARSEEGFQDYC